MPETPHAKFRLDTELLAQLDAIATADGKNRTEVVRALIRDEQGRRQREAERVGREGTRIIARLREVLGADCFEGSGGIDIRRTPSGAVGVTLGELTYYEHKGQLTAQRNRGGRAELAHVDDDGELHWFGALPLAAPEAN